MRRSPHSAGSSAAWISGIVFVAYLLSPGPVVRLLYGPHPRAPFPALDRALEIVYAPVIFVADHLPFVSAFYLWYFELWGM